MRSSTYAMERREEGHRPIGDFGISAGLTALTIAIVSWASATAASIAAALGISAAVVSAIATMLVTAGISAAYAGGQKALQALVDELNEDETDEAKYVNAFYVEQYEDQFTDDAAVINFIAGVKKRHGDKIAAMVGLKVWSRYKFVHEPMSVFVANGIAKDGAEMIAAVKNMAEGESADAIYASEFYSEQWDREYTSDAAVIAFIKGLQQRQGHRVGIMCGLKVWSRWKLHLEPKLLEAENKGKLSAALRTQGLSTSKSGVVATFGNKVTGAPTTLNTSRSEAGAADFSRPDSGTAGGGGEVLAVKQGERYELGVQTGESAAALAARLEAAGFRDVQPIGGVGAVATRKVQATWALPSTELTVDATGLQIVSARTVAPASDHTALFAVIGLGVAGAIGTYLYFAREKRA